MSEIELLSRIDATLTVMCALQIIDFCASCMRSWRNNIVKGVR